MKAQRNARTSVPRVRSSFGSRSGGRSVRRQVVLGIVVVPVAVVLAGCSSGGSSKSSAPSAPLSRLTDTTAAATTSTAPSLKEQARRSWEGIQLDVIGPKTVPLATTMFFQHGNWAAVAMWKTQNSWCLLNTYTWTVTSATSPTDFTVEYDQIHDYPACASLPADSKMTINVTGSRQQNNRTVYDIKYVSPAYGRATRTVCSAASTSTERCGYTTTGFTLPAPPTS
jgi:hypothetical protein